MSDVYWQKSTYSSEGNNCVELGRGEDASTLHVRESDDPAKVLTTSRTKLAGLLEAVRAGQLGGVAEQGAAYSR